LLTASIPDPFSTLEYGCHECRAAVADLHLAIIDAAPDSAVAAPVDAARQLLDRAATLLDENNNAAPIDPVPTGPATF
jgi:hypothetical protein